MKGAEVLSTVLESCGVEYAFGVAGSANLGCLDAISQSSIEFVTTRHEHVAASMAASYAMLTRTPTVSISHVGSGAANQIIGIAGANRGNIPVITITGNEPSYRLGNQVRHEWDVQAIFEEFTKHSVQVDRHYPVKQIRDAVRQAVIGLPGPVHIDFPRDLEEAEFPEPDEAVLAKLRAKDHTTGAIQTYPSPDSVEATLGLLEGAEQPVLLTGNEFRWFDAREELRTFAEAVEIPVGTSKYAPGSISERHPLSIGRVGRSAHDATNEYVQDADVVIVVGERLSDTLTTNWELVDDDASIVHASLADREFDRHYVADVNAIADPKSFLSALSDAVSGQHNLSFAAQAERTHTAVVADRERASDPTINPAEEGVDPRKVVSSVVDQVEEFSFTTGGGVHTSFPWNIPIEHLDMRPITGDFTGMSQGLPMGLGAQLALDVPVICFEGDGGFMMVIQDLETAVRERIPVKFIIFNNYSYMSQKARQKRYYGGRFTGSEYTNPPFDEVAQVFGMFGERVETDDEIPGAVERLMAADGPGLLDVQIDPWIGTGDYDRD